MSNTDNINNNTINEYSNETIISNINKQQEYYFRELFNRISHGKDTVEFKQLNGLFQSLGYKLDDHDIEGILKSYTVELNGEFTVDTLLEAFHNWKRKNIQSLSSSSNNINNESIKPQQIDNLDSFINTRRSNSKINDQLVNNKYQTTTSLLADKLIYSNRMNQTPTLGQLAENVQLKAKAETIHEIGDSDLGSDDEVGVITNGQEHTGRWTRQEHSLFLEALKKYGKEWKKVASMVKTRTVVQTRTHAQKYFQKQAKSNNVLSNNNYNINSDDFDSPSPVKNNHLSSNSSNNTSNNTSNNLSNHITSNKKIRNLELDNSYYNLPSGLKYNFSDENFDYDKQPIANFSALLTTPLTSIMFSPNNNYPQPSPAACGKRKHVELAVAKALAATATINSIDNSKLDS